MQQAAARREQAPCCPHVHMLCALRQANKIKGFLSKQKSRTTAATGKSEWLLVYQHLQEER